MMQITLWVLQVLMALVFLAHGLMLLFPPANLVDQMNASMSTALRIFIGVSEVAAAVGLTLPGITRILPWLVPAAAAGLTIVMVLATAFHIVRGEVSSAVIPTVLLAIVAFLAYMRWRVKPIPPRGAAAPAVQSSRQFH
jgi:uncharacterized membrane protein YphA (DoxX/SURF4 family)